jgi:hypothetical protein
VEGGGWGLGIDSAGVIEEFACRPDGLLDLPQRGAAIEAEGVQRADRRERRHFVAVDPGAADEVVERAETRFGVPFGVRRWLERPQVRAHVAEAFVRMQRFQHRCIITPALRTADHGRTLTLNPEPRTPYRRRRMRDLAAKPIHIHQPEPHAAIGFHAARPVRHLHVDRRKADAVALRVLHERRRVIEPHRLVVQHRRVERRRIVRLEIRARIHEQGETRRV